MIAPVLTAAPAETPVSLADAKAFLRIDHADEDAVVTAAIAAATAHLDGWTGILGRALVTQRWSFGLEAFADEIVLPLVPFATLVSIAYVDPAGVTQSLSPSSVAVVERPRGPTIVRPSGFVWPSTRLADGRDAVTITAEFGTAPAAVPAPLKQAILLLAADIYHTREAQVTGALSENAMLNMLVTPWRRVCG